MGNTTEEEGITAVQVTEYTFFTIIFLIGVFGNTLVCLVIVQTPRMRTTRNFLLVNLAVSDLMVALLCIPFDVALKVTSPIWPLGAAMCKVLWPAMTLFTNCSAATLAAISYDRWVWQFNMNYVKLFCFIKRCMDLCQKLVHKLLCKIKKSLKADIHDIFNAIKWPGPSRLSKLVSCYTMKELCVNVSTFWLRYFKPLGKTIWNYRRALISILKLKIRKNINNREKQKRPTNSPPCWEMIYISVMEKWVDHVWWDKKLRSSAVVTQTSVFWMEYLYRE